MSEIRERAQHLVLSWGRPRSEFKEAITDLLAELERVESQSEKYRLEMIRCGDGWEKANQRIAELEAENERLKAWKTGVEMGREEDQSLICSECKELNFVEQCHDARQQAALECVEIVEKYPAFLFGTDAVGVKLNLAQGIKAHFGLDG